MADNHCHFGRDAGCCLRNPSVCHRAVNASRQHANIRSATRQHRRQGLDPRSTAASHVPLGTPPSDAVSSVPVGRVSVPLPSLPQLHVCVTLVGTAIVPCDCSMDLRATGRVGAPRDTTARAECTVDDPGHYLVLYDDGSSSRPHTLQELTVTAAEDGSAASRLPQRPCRRSGMPARWVRRDAVCGAQQQHPLCAVPATEGGWQLVRRRAPRTIETRRLVPAGPAARTLLRLCDHRAGTARMLLPRVER